MGDILPVAILVLRTCFIATVAVLILVGNSLAIFVTRQMVELSNSTKILMTSLAVIDLLTGLTVLPSVVASAQEGWPLGNPACTAQGLLANWLYMVSALLVVLLNIQRYVAIAKPLRYRTLCTPRRVILAIVFPAGIIASVSFLQEFLLGTSIAYSEARVFCALDLTTLNRPLQIVIFLLTCVIPVAMMVFIQARIGTIIRRQARAFCSNGLQRPAGHAYSRKTEWRTTRLFLAVTLAFSFVWVPAQIFYVYAAFAVTPIASWLKFAIMWLCMCNSFINVFVYCLFNRNFRRVVAGSLRCRQCGTRVVAAPSSANSQR